MTITREQALAAKPVLTEVEVPEWGGSVWIRPVSLREQGTLAVAGTKYEKADALVKLKQQTIPLIMWAVTDENGDPLFSKEDVEVLFDKSAPIFKRLQDEILKVSGLTPEARAELEKNSETGQTAKLDS